MLLFLSLFFIPLSVNAADIKPVPLGLPARWDGDRYFHSDCETIQSPPDWVDGYLFAQIAGSYGERTNPLGQRSDHLFDAISGVASFDMTPLKTTFTGAYYPVSSFKIWDLYDRDFQKSTVAWGTTFTTYNNTAKKIWDPIIAESGIMTSQPNVDFWRINDSIIAGTEMFSLGLTFDIDTTSNFRTYPFKDDSTILLGKPFQPIHMPIHERVDPDTGLIWHSVLAFNTTADPMTFHQAVFTVDPSGTRHVEGVYDFPPFDPKLCRDDGSYTGDAKTLPRYMHTTHSTQNYFVMPLTSLVLKPCQLIGFGRPSSNETLVDGNEQFPFNYTNDATLRFLIYDKVEKKFLPIIDSNEAHFVTHVFNGYEPRKDQLYLDVTSYDFAAYSTLSVESLLSTPEPSPTEDMNNALRFMVDLKSGTVTKSLLIEGNRIPLEFPQFNHKFEGKKYKYGYAVGYPMYEGGKILKIDMDTPSGKNNKEFQPKENVALSEAYFASSPHGTEEDDGVLVFRGLDPAINKTRIYVVDAKTMEQVGQFLAPTSVPFGLHERFYTKASFEHGDTPSSTPAPLSVTPTAAPISVTPTPTPVPVISTTNSGMRWFYGYRVEMVVIIFTLFYGFFAY